LWPDGVTPLADDTGRAVVGKAGELKMPVGMLCSVNEHSSAIDALCSEFPQTPIIFDQ
jgi:hypothetical protein